MNSISNDTDHARHLELFEEHRRQLLGAAYRFLGSYSDAEDVVQEAWLRWTGVNLGDVDDARAYLLRITTRLALNRLRTIRRQRETYVGEWLPEPVSDVPSVEPERVVETADSVSMAMMVVLESLSPLERAAFILREVFGMNFAEIAGTLDRSESAVRQLSHRARAHVRERAPRHPVDPEEHREITLRFLEAMQTGNIDSLMQIVAPDAVLVTDGGGKKAAAIRPIRTRDHIVRWIEGVQSKGGFNLSMVPGTVNGELALLVTDGSAVDTVIFLQIANREIERIYAVRNPAKLTAVEFPGIMPTSVEGTPE
jgi:RNA polymerase sigma-70 factor (ECF subfamily)